MTSVHQLVHVALNAGKIPRKPCEICGATKAQMHHDNYMRPFDIRWLCVKHHRQWHTNFKAENRDVYKSGIWVPLDETTLRRMREAKPRDERNYKGMVQRGLDYYLERSERGEER